MNSIEKAVLWITVIVLVIWGGVSFFKKGGSNEAQSNEPIKIGLILPLTGDYAFIGEAAKNGASLALDKAVSSGQLRHKYELVIEDDSFDTKKTVSALNKMISVDSVDAVVSLASGAGNVVAPIAEKNKLPHIGLASDSNVAKGDYNFIHWTRPQEEVDMMLSELIKRKLSNVAVIYMNQQGWEAIFQDLAQKSSKVGITLVSVEKYNPGEKDFKTIITSTSKKNPNVYILGAFTPELEILGKQMNELGVKQPVTSIESFGLTDKPVIFEGQWFIDSAVPAGVFKDEYKAKYNKEVGPTAGNVYDAVSLFMKAVEATGNFGKPGGSDIAAQLSKIKDYSGAFGLLDVTPDGAFISQPTVKIIKDGKAVELK